MKKYIIFFIALLLVFLKFYVNDDTLYVDKHNEYKSFDFNKSDLIKEKEVVIEEKKVENFIDNVNNIRAKYGLSALSSSTELDYSSNIRSNEIKDYFSHKRPDGSDYDTVITTNPMCSGENIASGYNSIDDVMEGWMNSPGHRNNILNSRYRYVSVTSVTYNGATYWDMLLTC